MHQDWFWLARPVVPSHRAQAIQVVHAAWAMADRGHRVQLCVQSTERPEAILDHFGLSPLPTLRLVVLPLSATFASVAYRAVFAAWVLRTRGRGIALARSRRHADQATRWARGRFRLVFEAHGAEYLWSPSGPVASVQALEERVLRRSWGLVANCQGTLAALRATHRRLPPAIVAHNAARPGPPRTGRGEGIGIVGSLRAYKDPRTVAQAAALGTRTITWIGPAESELASLLALSEGRLRATGPLAPRDVAARLARFETLLLPLSPGLFGEELTSPLKLWDALQSGAALVAGDTPAIRRAAGGAYVPYRPGDPEDLARALERACTDEPLRRRVLDEARLRARTWGDRAAEIEAFVARITA